MIEIQPVAVEAALAHQQAISNATHLLSCTDYLLQSLPEKTQELPILADLTVLLDRVGAEISAARVKFETADKPQPQTAPFATYEEIHGRPQIDAAHADLFRIYGLATYLEDYLGVLHKGGRSPRQACEIVETIKSALGEMIDKSGIITTPAIFLAATDIAHEADREAKTRWPGVPAAGRPFTPCPPRPCPPATA